MNKPLSFAVVTATIGRPELENAILSVRAQQHPCTHYVFVDGAQYADAVRPLQQKYPDTVFTYLPFNTGADGWYNSHILAAASCLLKEDVICFLDDDNTYAPEHITTFARLFAALPDIAFAYSLRNFHDRYSGSLNQDHHESLGFYEKLLPAEVDIGIRFRDTELPVVLYPARHRMIDVNCYAMRRLTAVRLAPCWLIEGFGNDAHIFANILNLDLRGACTGCFTVNYRHDLAAMWQQGYRYMQDLGADERETADVFMQCDQAFNDLHIQAYMHKYGRLPWLDNRRICLPEHNRNPDI